MSSGFLVDYTYIYCCDDFIRYKALQVFVYDAKISSWVMIKPYWLEDNIILNHCPFCGCFP